jgi:hypothetical protein
MKVKANTGKQQNPMSSSTTTPTPPPPSRHVLSNGAQASQHVDNPAVQGEDGSLQWDREASRQVEDFDDQPGPSHEVPRYSSTPSSFGKSRKGGELVSAG